MLQALIAVLTNDRWMPDKSHTKSKIDAMVATLMALAECMFQEREQEWEEEELGV